MMKHAMAVWQAWTEGIEGEGLLAGVIVGTRTFATVRIYRCTDEHELDPVKHEELFASTRSSRFGASDAITKAYRAAANKAHAAGYSVRLPADVAQNERWSR